MDLFEQNADGGERKALERLEAIVALYQSADETVQDEALSRAITYCGNQWQGYRTGIELLADTIEAEGADPMVVLRLREEAEDPGAIIRACRARLAEMGQEGTAKAEIIARYGSLAAALAPGPLERLFIEAARHLSEDPNDPRAPLAGWSLPWHPIPEALKAVVSRGLPTGIAEARDETLAWEYRLGELDVLSGGAGRAALPTACAARLRLVLRLWAAELPAVTPADIDIRLDYWVGRGGGDGSGYAVIQGDFRRLAQAGGLARPIGGTAERVRRLKQEHADWSLARIGKELGISRQAVHKHLQDRTRKV